MQPYMHFECIFSFIFACVYCFFLLFCKHAYVELTPAPTYVHVSDVHAQENEEIEERARELYTQRRDNEYAKDNAVRL